jgi:hypothetical protein
MASCGLHFLSYIDDLGEIISESRRIEPPRQSGVTRSEFMELPGKPFVHLPFCLVLKKAVNFNR